MPKQTAMQIMLDELLSHGYKIPFHLVEKCKELLEVEKEQIEDAYGDALNGHRVNYCDRNDYYNKTYGGQDGC